MSKSKIKITALFKNVYSIKQENKTDKTDFLYLLNIYYCMWMEFFSIHKIITKNNIIYVREENILYDKLH